MHLELHHVRSALLATSPRQKEVVTVMAVPMAIIKMFKGKVDARPVLLVTILMVSRTVMPGAKHVKLVITPPASKLNATTARMAGTHTTRQAAAKCVPRDTGFMLTLIEQVPDRVVAALAHVVTTRPLQESSTAMPVQLARTITRVVAPVMVHWPAGPVRRVSTVWVLLRQPPRGAPARTALLASSKLGKHTMGSLHMRAASIVSQAGSLRVAGAIRTARPVLVVGSNEMPRRATALNATQGSILQQGTMNVKNVRQADT